MSSYAGKINDASTGYYYFDEILRPDDWDVRHTRLQFGGPSGFSELEPLRVCPR